MYDQEFTTEIIVLEHASAADVVRTLEEVMSESRRAAAKRVAPGSCVLYPPGAQPLEPRPSLRVEVFANSNAVRIRARPDDLPRIRDLIARLDGVYPNHRISESREPR